MIFLVRLIRSFLSHSSGGDPRLEERHALYELLPVVVSSCGFSIVYGIGAIRGNDPGFGLELRWEMRDFGNVGLYHIDM
jgi:hypothetical protein